MKISVKITPNSKKQSITKDPEIAFHYKIKLNSPPEKGKANKELIKLLSKYFKIPKNKIVITKGLKLRQKIISLDI